MKRPRINDLIYGADDALPQPYDWHKHYHSEAYRIYEAVECCECKAIVICDGHGEERHCELDNETDCEGFVGSSGPMMNYYYPFTYFRGDPEEAARKLIDLPLCLVYFEDINVREEESYAL